MKNEALTSRVSMALVVVVLLILAACGNATAESATAGSSPLSELLGVPSNQADAEEFFEAAEREAEEKIRICMTEKGFEYEPQLNSNGPGVIGGDPSDPEYRAQYGYGITTTFEETFLAFEGPFGGDDPTADMSPEEAAAFQEALWGPPIEFDEGEESGGLIFDGDEFEPQGCAGVAYDEAFNAFNVFDKFSDELEEMERRFEADPRIVEIYGDWRECLSAAGYDYETPEAIFEDLFERMMDLQMSVFGEPPSFDGEMLDGERLDGEMFEGGGDGEMPEGAQFVFEPPELDAAGQAELDELQAYEIGLAEADWSCKGDTEAEILEIRYEYEQTFIDENRDALEAAAQPSGS